MFTNAAIHIVRGACSETIEYCQIAKIGFEKSLETAWVPMTLLDGRLVNIPVVGGDVSADTRDFAVVTTFLIRASEYVRSGMNCD